LEFKGTLPPTYSLLNHCQSAANDESIEGKHVTTNPFLAEKQEVESEFYSML